MPGPEEHKADKIFEINNSAEFLKKALEVFRFQYRHNLIYQHFCNGLNKHQGNVKTLVDIPFLPVEFFKNYKIVSGNFKPEIVFSSSSTSGTGQSLHYVKDLGLYEASFMEAFERFYGQASELVILALLPSYLEREGSSLVFMAEALIKAAAPGSGFFLHDYENLVNKIQDLEQKGQKTLLIGVTYALLDLAEQFSMKLSHATIMETGGMKGKRKEMIREEVHQIIQNAFGVPTVHSEYGMTELLSQAYSKGNGVFYCPPWMKILIREVNDPLSFLPQGQSGGINIIDLANIYSCAFLSTSDLGKNLPDGGFEVLGRFDNSDIRGCNLLVQ
ncbi:MAG: acyl transferase [Bacteroidetes bacterium]|nr:acyl transferase [Bacteroidota bacterium]